MFLPYCFFVGKTTAKAEQEKETKDIEKGKNSKLSIIFNKILKLDFVKYDFIL